MHITISFIYKWVVAYVFVWQSFLKLVSTSCVHSYVFFYLQLSTNALASSRRESGNSAVVQSVMLKKCFSRPINVDWSHRGASISNELTAIAVLLALQSKNQSKVALKCPDPAVTLWALCQVLMQSTQPLWSKPEKRKTKSHVCCKTKCM